MTVPSPGGRPLERPRFRVLIHKSDWKDWRAAFDQAGLTNMVQLWDHLAHRPDRPPLLGTVTRLRGHHMQGRDGWSAVHHYELTGAARVNYQFHPAYIAGGGDPHPVVKIIEIALGSH